MEVHKEKQCLWKETRAEDTFHDSRCFRCFPVDWLGGEAPYDDWSGYGRDGLMECLWSEMEKVRARMVTAEKTSLVTEKMTLKTTEKMALMTTTTEKVTLVTHDHLLFIFVSVLVFLALCVLIYVCYDTVIRRRRCIACEERRRDENYKEEMEACIVV